MTLDGLGIQVTELDFKGDTIVAPWPLPESPPELPPLLSSEPAAAGVTEQLVLGDTLGAGGMGVVRSAWQTALSREVAVKMVHRTPTTPRAAAALMREAWVTGWLEHPNVVPIHALGQDADGQPILVMKRVDGTSWSEAIASARPAERQTEAYLRHHLGILVQVATAIEYAHTRGIVHRDLKPENVMVGGFNEVYIVDWGIAVRISDQAPEGVPHARDIARIEGTPHYMAPEMVVGDGARIGTHTDVYLLGATLYHVVMGRGPHEAPNLQATLYRSLSGTPPAFDPSVSPELRAIVERAMDPDPEQRFESAAAFARALSAYLSHRGSLDLAREAERRASEVTALVETTESPTAEQEARAREAFHEARFGYEHALRVWPENELAASGRAVLLESLAELELRRGAPTAALDLLHQLPSPSPDLEARAAVALAEEEERVRRLGELERDADLSVGIEVRSRRLMAGAVVFTVGSVGAGLLARHGVLEVKHWHFAVLGGVLLLGNLGGALLRPAHVLATATNRLVVLNLALTVASCSALWVLLGEAGVSLPLSTATVVLVAGAMLTLNVALMGRRWLPLPLSTIPCLLGLWVWPEYPLELLGVLGLGGIASGFLMRRHIHHEAPPDRAREARPGTSGE
ncbi:MAG: serine/threonine protein kinase [Myxococcales bacterium]|nr:serine/threonine protein kinase [Myxococcales bacterium]